MSTIPEALASLRRSRRRSAWVLLGLALVIAINLEVFFRDSGTLGSGIVVPLAILAAIVVLIYLLVVQIDILLTEKRLRRGESDPGPSATRSVGKPLSVKIGWIVALAAFPMIVLFGGAWYPSMHNAQYEMFAVGERLGEIMNAVDGYYMRHGRLPATNVDLGLPGKETLKYKMFDLEKFKDLPITYRIADGNVEMSIEGDPGRTIAFASIPSGKELGWNWVSTGTLESRARGSIEASARSVVNKTMRSQGETREPLPGCNDQQPATINAQAQADTTRCDRKPGQAGGDGR